MTFPETGRLLHSYQDYLFCQSFSHMLGEKTRAELFESLDWLLKARSVISIYANGGIDAPNIGPSPQRVYNQGVLEGVLEAFSCASFLDFRGQVFEKREIIKNAIASAIIRYSPA